MSRSMKETSQEITLHSAVTGAALAGPASAGDTAYGKSMSTWVGSGFKARGASISIDVAVGTPATLAGPVSVLVLDGTKWRDVGMLNGGADIVITDIIGFERKVYDVAVNDQLALKSGTITGGTVTVKAKPIATHEE